MPKSTWLENSVLDAYLRNIAPTRPATVYLALLTADLPDDGTIANEVTGGSYARRAITFDTAASGRTANTNAINITNMPAAEITHYALMTALTGGNVLWYGSTSAPIILLAGEPFDLPVGALEVQEY